ncbi:hypothetical protein R6V09_19775 [Streptomyces sp. W16]|uniref:hypothetical protein n=1 Tax=Streptomyces sp. W16 TaxID=3076631 RepID=UPI00295B15E6|nr:hypothetical protein [Streptomyces sp. W16]MDV9172331.1 hypothetical protein [Streptomyces sp. W16]
MSPLTITWTLRHHGWAFCTVTDDQSEAEVFASYVTDGPEQFLRAVTRLMLMDKEARAEFEGEPQVYRWLFRREGTDADIRLLRANNSQTPDNSGVVLWSSRQTITALRRAALRAFDQVTHDLGEEGYASQWGRPFPRAELEALRAALHTIRDGHRPHPMDGTPRA